jgi:hypothetical protein
MKTINNTNRTLEEIEAYPVVKVVRNNWRQRTITLHQVSGTSLVYSVGITYDGKSRIVCEDHADDWARELAMTGDVVTTS